MTALLEILDATIDTPSGRPLFKELSLRLARDRVALIGRNGVGKSTLLAVLAGLGEAQKGAVKASARRHFVPQSLVSGEAPRARAMSHGELRKAALIEAKSSGAEILLLDEPSEDLDEPSVAWLRRWLQEWPGCLVMASHDRRLLADFRHFFFVSESGCRYFFGTLTELDAELEREHERAQERYVRSLNQLASKEEHTAQVASRRARKKRSGRCRELDRATPRIRLNQKRDHAQVYQGRFAKIRRARLEALRQWSQSTRRAVGVNLALELPVPILPAPGTDVLVLCGVSAHDKGRGASQPLDLRVARQRLAVVGPNGAGKTTLLEIMLGRRSPAAGAVFQDLSRIGAIAQGGADWMLDQSLLEYLSVHAAEGEPGELAKLLVAHKFPLALADRPLCSLSPGERARAALICLYRRSPAVELLILDEPTYSLDLVGQRAMTEALRAWPGGLVVASHDRAFLQAIGVETWVEVVRRR
jgi:ATPase subunit of ABC transporter with duplicated ATPase domains